MLLSRTASIRQIRKEDLSEDGDARREGSDPRARPTATRLCADAKIAASVLRCHFEIMIVVGAVFHASLLRDLSRCHVIGLEITSHGK